MMFSGSIQLRDLAWAKPEAKEAPAWSWGWRGEGSCLIYNLCLVYYGGFWCFDWSWKSLKTSGCILPRSPNWRGQKSAHFPLPRQLHRLLALQLLPWLLAAWLLARLMPSRGTETPQQLSNGVLYLSVRMGTVDSVLLQLDGASSVGVSNCQPPFRSNKIKNNSV